MIFHIIVADTDARLPYVPSPKSIPLLKKAPSKNACETHSTYTGDGFKIPKYLIIIFFPKNGAVFLLQDKFSKRASI